MPQPSVNPAARKAQAAASKAAEDEARLKKEALRLASIQKGRSLSPPPLGWEWEPKVLMADGASAVDKAVAEVFGGSESAASDAAPTFNLAPGDVAYWSGEDVTTLCKALEEQANCGPIGFDAEWNVPPERILRPRPG